MVYVKLKSLEMETVRYLIIKAVYKSYIFELILMIFPILQFCALSDQLFRSPEHHKHVRNEIVKQVCML